jgi:hypothetical protein
MNPHLRVLWQCGLVAAFVLGLFLVFPTALGFVEMAAREIRYLWWLILLVALAVWLIWAGRRRSK